MFKYIINKSSKKDSQFLKNFSEIEYDEKIEKMRAWDMPLVPNDKIYHIETFDFMSKKIIKNVERTIPIKDHYETIQLFDPGIFKYKDRYKFLHIGLIQVALKPLTREGLNVCLMVALRDCRHLKFDASLLGLIETSLCNGPVYFNCFPDFILSLTDENLLQVLTLNKESKGYDMTKNREHVAISYRIYYKVLVTLTPKTKLYSKKGKTTLIETNLAKSHIMTPRAISWQDISLPPIWTLPSAAPPEPIENRQIEQIIQTPEGDAEVTFSNSGRKINFKITEFSKSMREGRHSVASMFQGASSSSSFREKDDLIFEGIKESNQKIPHGIYITKNPQNQNIHL